MWRQHFNMRAAGKENLAPPSYQNRSSDAITASSVYTDYNHEPVVRPLFAKWSEISPPSSPDQLNSPDTADVESNGDVSPVQGVQGVAAPGSNANHKTAHRLSVLGPKDPNSRGNEQFQQVRTQSEAQKATKTGFNLKGLRIITGPREPWRGASGRSAVLPRIVDKPLPIEKRLIVPLRSPRRPSTTQTKQPLQLRPVSVVDRSTTEPRVPSIAHCDLSDEEEEIKPIVPLKVSRNSLTRSGTPSSRKSLDTPLRPATPQPRSQTPVTSKPRMADANTWIPISAYKEGHPSPRRASVDSAAQLRVTFQAPDIQQRKHEQHPVSRFSWTTAATSAAYQSPPYTPVPEFQAPPTPRPASSILDRKRPVTSPNFNPGPTYPPITFRKPRLSQFSLESSISPSDSISQHDRRSSIISTTSKALPLTPAELASVDLVTSLQAQLDDVRHRRLNLQKLLSGVTQLQPQNPVVQDLAKRRQVKERAETLEREIEGLRREEHELGLRLHRAWKRREGGTEGSNVLWVRRVTA